LYVDVKWRVMWGTLIRGWGGVVWVWVGGGGGGGVGGGRR